MTQHKVVPHAEWLAARTRLLDQEKQFTRQRDQLSQQRRDLPWERVDKDYRFEGPDGERALADLFDGRSQLIVHHFMFGPDWEEGCKSCSFWADNYVGILEHLAHRDVTLAAISRAPLGKLQSYARRMGWTFPWFSSLKSAFNFDYYVSFTPEQISGGATFHNYELRPTNTMSDLTGYSVFFKDQDGAIYHTYSAYSRGVDMLNGAYHYLDIVPKGRDEDGLAYSMEWLRRRDQYE